jgi:hypothetical protein
MPRPSHSTPDLDRLLVRALCQGDTPDADRATLDLYEHLLGEVIARAGDTDAPCIVAALMFSMARRFIPGPPCPTPAAAVVDRPIHRRPSLSSRGALAPLRLAA